MVNKKNKLIFLLFVITVIIVIFNKNNLFYKEKSNKQNLIAVYVDNIKKSEIPSKDSGYEFIKSTCNKEDTVLDWNNDTWKYNLTNISGSVSCTLYFKLSDFTYSKEFTYTGSSQEWVVPKTGTYKIELWGASNSINGRKLNSAYLSGDIELNKDKNLYLFLGGSTNNMNGGFNGGGSGSRHPSDNPYSSTGGAGGTDIRTVNGNWNDTQSLRSRIMVASGSAGNTYDSTIVETNEDYLMNGSGGGLIGINSGSIYGGYPGTQTKGGDKRTSYGCGGTPGTGGSFGIGGNGGINGQTAGNPGSGSGYYGGGGAQDICSGSGGGASGSSYISGHTGCVAINSATDQTPKLGCDTGTTNNTCSIHYSGLKFTNTKIIDGQGYSWTNVKGNKEQMPKINGDLYPLGQGYTGNGYAKITYIKNN